MNFWFDHMADDGINHTKDFYESVSCQEQHFESMIELVNHIIIKLKAWLQAAIGNMQCLSNSNKFMNYYFPFGKITQKRIKQIAPFDPALRVSDLCAVLDQRNKALVLPAENGLACPSRLRLLLTQRFLTFRCVWCVKGKDTDDILSVEDDPQFL